MARSRTARSVSGNCGERRARPIAVRRWAWRGGALLLGALAGMVLAELLLRLVHLGPDQNVAFATAAEFSRLPGIHAPNQRLTLHTPVPYRAHIDSLGYRGADFPRARPAGELRIFLVGDSFGFGAYVDDDSTLAAQLERALRPSCGTVRVINGSFGGATITEEAELIARGLTLRPDLVLLEVTGNDVEDLLPQPSLWDQLAADRLAKSHPPLSLLYPILHRSVLWRLARSALAARRARLAARRLQSVGLHDSLTQRLRADYWARFLALRDTLAAARVPFAAATYPVLRSLRDETSDGAWLERALPRSGVPIFDLRQPLLGSHLPDDALYLVPRDTHPTARGYGIAARVIADGLRRLPSLTGRCAASGG
jgi:lysophospholipase L1-like esterase